MGKAADIDVAQQNRWLILATGKPSKAVVLGGRLFYPLGTVSSGAIVSGQTLKIGTRKSAMALAQTEAIARMLRAADGALDV